MLRWLAVLLSIATVGAAEPVRVSTYAGTTWGIALGVEDGGRVHVLWNGIDTGQSDFGAYYSTSANGADWSAYQALDTGNAFDPNVAVDDVHGVVHLVYRSNTRGILHHTVVGGVVSPPTTIVAPAGPVVAVNPRLAVDPSTGAAYVLYTRRNWNGESATDTSMYARWSGSSWSTPVSPRGDDASLWSALAVAPGGAVMIAGLVSGVPRTAVASDGVTFGGVVSVSSGYGWPERDSALSLHWSPADGTFHLETQHDVWAGSSELYHWRWNGSAWVGPENASVGTTDGWSCRQQLDSAAAAPFLYHSWMEDDETGTFLQARWQQGTALGPIVDIGRDLGSAGVAVNFNLPHDVFLGRGGVPHLAVGAWVYVAKGVYYQRLQPALRAVAGDFDGDGKADVRVFHGASGLWFVSPSAGGPTSVLGYGGPGATVVPADYDGDRKADRAVYYEASGLWYVRQSTDAADVTTGFGGDGYDPQPRDYDGDGKVDLAVFHPATGLWFLRSSSTGATSSVGYGGSTSIPVPADYDGDGRNDLAVYYEASGLWYVRGSSTGADHVSGFGSTGYQPVPADYDGDGKVDLAVFHGATGLWFVTRSSSGELFVLGYGGPGATPVVADYDGDQLDDLAVYYAGSGLWFIRQASGTTRSQGFGGPAYAPLR